MHNVEPDQYSPVYAPATRPALRQPASFAAAAALALRIHALALLWRYEATALNLGPLGAPLRLLLGCAARAALRPALNAVGQSHSAGLPDPASERSSRSHGPHTQYVAPSLTALEWPRRSGSSLRHDLIRRTACQLV
jgi:hypothetical protein